MSNLDVRQTAMLNQLKQIQVEEFLAFHLNRLLFNTTKEVIESTGIIKISKEVFKRLICNFYKITFDSSKHYLLLVSFNYKRADHQQSWDSFKKIFKEYDELKIEGCGFEKKNLLRVGEIFNSIVLFLKLNRRLKLIHSYAERSILSAHLVELARLKKVLESKGFNNRVMVQYFDGSEYENLTAQFFRQKSIKTVVLQHGQPVFHGKEVDRINQNIILNFSSDYILVPGEFAKKQCLLGGIPEESIEVVGTLRQIQQFKKCNSKEMSVFLDCPTLPNAANDNRMLIAICDEYCIKNSYQFVIKCHPQDCPENYQDVLISSGMFLKAGASINDALANKEFAVLHVSGVYLDILSRGVKAFCMVSKTEFPLVEFELDSFESFEKLNENITIWNHMDEEKRKKYFSKVVEYYLSPHKAKERNKSFVTNLVRRV